MPRLQLVPDWKASLRWWSVRLSLLNVALLQVWTELPPDLKSAIPPNWMATAASVLALLAVAARVIAQEATASTNPPPENRS